MLKKRKVLDFIKDMPETFSAEEFIERILLLQKIEEGMVQSKTGNTYSVQQVEGKLKKWLK